MPSASDRRHPQTSEECGLTRRSYVGRIEQPRLGLFDQIIDAGNAEPVEIIIEPPAPPLPDRARFENESCAPKAMTNGGPKTPIRNFCQRGFLTF